MLRDPDYERHLPDPEQHPDLFVVGDYLFDATINGVLDSVDTVVCLVEERVEELAAEETAATLNGILDSAGMVSLVSERATDESTPWTVYAAGDDTAEIGVG